MGKFRGHQDKSRRGREKKHLKKMVGKGILGMGGRGPDSAATGEATGGGGGKVINTAGGKNVPKNRKLKHVTYGKDQSVLICGDGDFSFTRGVIRHRGTGYVRVCMCMCVCFACCWYQHGGAISCSALYWWVG